MIPKKYIKVIENFPDALTEITKKYKFFTGNELKTISIQSFMVIVGINWRNYTYKEIPMVVRLTLDIVFFSHYIDDFFDRGDLLHLIQGGKAIEDFDDLNDLMPKVHQNLINKLILQFKNISELNQFKGSLLRLAFAGLVQSSNFKHEYLVKYLKINNIENYNSGYNLFYVSLASSLQELFDYEISYIHNSKFYLLLNSILGPLVYFSNFLDEIEKYGYKFKFELVSQYNLKILDAWSNLKKEYLGKDRYFFHFIQIAVSILLMFSMNKVYQDKNQSSLLQIKNIYDIILNDILLLKDAEIHIEYIVERLTLFDEIFSPKKGK